MAKLIMTKGLPGSGKSTWAKAQVEKVGGLNVVRVNKDEIRIALGMDRKSYSRDQEYRVVDRRDDYICKALMAGCDVIVDDTNFGKKHEPRLRELAKRFGADFLIQDFTHVPVEECIRHDSLREGDARVGADVIWGMAETHLGLKRPPTPDVVVVYDDPTLPSVVICDLDGTLALHEGLRGPYEHEKAANDRVNAPVRRLISNYLGLGYGLIYLSGREEKFRSQTEEFLRKNDCPKAPLYMRTTGDSRNDTIVKRELFNAHILGKFRVEFALDDRDRVVKLWRDMGLTCFQVNYGAF